MIIELHEVTVENGVRGIDVPVLRNTNDISAVGKMTKSYTAPTTLKVHGCYVTTGAGPGSTIFVSESYSWIRGLIKNAELHEFKSTQL